MDKLIYTAMTGARATMSQQASVANNLANAATTGFRSELHRLRAVPVESQALSTRAFAVDASVGVDYSAGPMSQTGRALDVAVTGKGWLVVRGADGNEALTRSGSFETDANGVLRTRGGLEVVGDGGQIAIPADNAIEIAPDGTITAVPLTGTRSSASVAGRLKLVSPPEEKLQRGEDGLFRLQDGSPFDQDDTVKVAGGYLEGSNVNVVEQMVSMISLARNYEMHIRMLQTAQENDKAATTILASR